MNSCGDLRLDFASYIFTRPIVSSTGAHLPDASQTDIELVSKYEILVAMAAVSSGGGALESSSQEHESGYNLHVDALRETEYPMLRGRAFPKCHGSND